MGDHEFALMAEQSALADRFAAEIIDRDIADSRLAEPGSGVGSLVSLFADKIAYFL